ncbi:MAG: alginate lyase family protein, partial [Phycisphaerae bacterium]|nr:alginate lyase family protein [Phycisphaerae bacterium]
MATEVTAKAQPWYADWQNLQAAGYAKLGASPRPLQDVDRGGSLNNFAQMYIDIQRAYDTAIEWKVTGNTAYADQTVTFLNAWSSTNTALTGDSDRFLASGLYGFQWANIAEIMRSYSGWSAASQTQFQNYLLNIYLPMNQNFLANHNGAYITNYWANWDLCNIASEMAIGVVTDRHDLYTAALNYVYSGAGNGAFDKAVYYTEAGNLGQGQEEGRDQGHSNLDFALMGEICQMAWNQGDDLFSYHNNEFLAATEYLAKYNLGNTVPYEVYKWGNGQSGAAMSQTTIGSGSMGQLRPIFELVYNHYVTLEGLSAPYTTQALAKTRPEGDNGNGDEYSWGTLLFALTPVATPEAPQSLIAYAKGNGNIQLDWWGGANDTTYNVYRATSSAGTYTKIASGITTFTYTDSNLSAGMYYYKVTGVAGAVETAASNVASETASSLLVAQLKFDETSGTTASDSTGNGVTGTLNGGATFVTGKSGDAVSLDGSTGYVSLPSGAISSVSDFTIATWVYLNSSQTWARIFDFGDGRGDWMFLTVKNSTGVPMFATSTTYAYNEQTVAGKSALPLNQWVHVAVTFSNRLATLYV